MGLLDVLTGHEQHKLGLPPCLGPVKLERKIAAGGVGVGWPVHNVHIRHVYGAEHVLEEGEAAIVPKRGEMLELVGPPGHGRGRTVGFEGAAAFPLTDVKQAVWVVKLLIQPSVSPPNNTVGWK